MMSYKLFSLIVYGETYYIVDWNSPLKSGDYCFWTNEWDAYIYKAIEKEDDNIWLMDDLNESTIDCPKSELGIIIASGNEYEKDLPRLPESFVNYCLKYDSPEEILVRYDSDELYLKNGAVEVTVVLTFSQEKITQNHEK